jgi:hypothetical protein
MKKEFYRFRRINSLIGEFEELENQSIYFAEPESLNDPMEGFRDMYWRGDFIVWRNQGESMSVHFSPAAVIPAKMTCSR